MHDQNWGFQAHYDAEDIEKNGRWKNVQGLELPQNPTRESQKFFKNSKPGGRGGPNLTFTEIFEKK